MMLDEIPEVLAEKYARYLKLSDGDKQVAASLLIADAVLANSAHVSALAKRIDDRLRERIAVVPGGKK